LNSKKLVQNSVFLFLTECQPLQFWLISRHGTRYPPAYGIASLQTLPSLRDEIVTSHVVQKSEYYYHGVILTLYLYAPIFSLLPIFHQERDIR